MADAEEDRRSGTAGERLAAEQAKRLRLAETLVNVSRTVAAMESLDDVLEIMVRLTTEVTGAERGTLFINDESTGELYSRVASPGGTRELRLLNSRGIAGKVFQSGVGVVVNDAYTDPNFNREIDQQTGFHTESIVCAPVRTAVFAPRQKAVGGLHVAMNHAVGVGSPQRRENLLEDRTSPRPRGRRRGWRS